MLVLRQISHILSVLRARLAPCALLCAPFILCAVIAAFVVPQAQAQDAMPVDLELVLAVDISLSMDPEEQLLQREGYAAAFRDPHVRDAIKGGGWGKIAVTYVEWAGTGTAKTVVGWHLIDSDASAETFAAALEAAAPARARRTSVSGGLLAAAEMFDRNRYQGLRRVIDISGDGPNNQGPPVTGVRDRLVGRGIVINGLPLQLNRGTIYSYFDIENLDDYYADCVIGGTGAFSLPVRDIARFAEAVRQKLVLEIAQTWPGTMVQPATQISSPRNGDTDCLIGEKLWDEWIRRGFMAP